MSWDSFDGGDANGGTIFVHFCVTVRCRLSPAECLCTVMQMLRSFGPWSKTRGVTFLWQHCVCLSCASASGHQTITDPRVPATPFPHQNLKDVPHKMSELPYLRKLKVRLRRSLALENNGLQRGLSPNPLSRIRGLQSPYPCLRRLDATRERARGSKKGLYFPLAIL